ncbi:hypothetical protein AMECASPLE_034862 [Ameca splendens]|uniref:Uncharacterized protein n=1 Tax=Ameca splendens TaxID=208324 RepID=A0ABV0XWH8_9TELE
MFDCWRVDHKHSSRSRAGHVILSPCHSLDFILSYIWLDVWFKLHLNHTNKLQASFWQEIGLRFDKMYSFPGSDWASQHCPYFFKVRASKKWVKKIMLAGFIHPKTRMNHYLVGGPNCVQVSII